MVEENDQFLRELYNQGRPNQDVEPPDFEEVMNRAQASTRREGWRRRPVWMGAAAAVLVATLAWLLLTLEPSPAEDEPEPSAVAAEAVVAEWNEEEGAPTVEGLVAEDYERWEDLLEFADEIWDWESPTDFLL
jgi:hypothetical protein